uniref:Uncharacterized protein n=1 Tax=Anopheles coluzzii TaxID=1518534 RepID=A0A8W7PXY7_ANOCL
MKASDSTVKLWSATSSPSSSTERLYPARTPEPSVVPGGGDDRRTLYGAPAAVAAPYAQRQNGDRQLPPPASSVAGTDTAGTRPAHSASEHITLNLAGYSADHRSMKSASSGGDSSGRPRATPQHQHQGASAATEATYGVSVAPSSTAYGHSSVNSNHSLPGTAGSNSRSRHGYGGSSYGNGSIAGFNINGSGGERSAYLPWLSLCYHGKMRMFVFLLGVCLVSVVAYAHYVDNSPITRIITKSKSGQY